MDKAFSLYSKGQEFAKICDWVFEKITPYIITFIAKGLVELKSETKLEEIEAASTKITHIEDTINTLVISCQSKYNEAKTTTDLSQRYIESFYGLTKSDLSVNTQACLIGEFVSLINHEIDDSVPF